MRVTEAEIKGIWDITFPDAVFKGGMAIQGPFRAKLSSEPRARCG